MLAKAQIQQLVHNSKLDRALSGNLLPLNNNECFLNLGDLSSVTIVDDDPKGCVPVAFGLFNRCSANQVYCSIVSVSHKYDSFFVNAEKVKYKNGDLGLTDDCPSNHSVMKLTNVMKELPDLSGLPQYFSAFAEPVARPLLSCVVDQLIEQTVGNVNVEMCRNLTVDLYDAEADMPEHSDALWRDFSGFVVSDRFRYREITIDRTTLTEELKNYFVTVNMAKEIVQEDGTKIPYRIEPINKSNACLVIEYDQTVAVMNREEYLEHLMKLSGVAGVVAIDAQNQPLGYLITLNNRILQCYAESPAIANQLFLEQMDKHVADDQITMFVRLGNDNWVAENLVEKASKVRRVRRFHTRVVPSNVKWTKIYSYNMGVHLF